MKTTLYDFRRTVAVLAAGLVFNGGVILSAHADMYRMAELHEGGIPAASVITSYTQTSSNATLSWYGLQGWYSIEAATNIAGPWSSVASVKATDFSTTKTVSNPDSTNAYFFQLNQANSFAGSGECGSCHGDKYATWKQTEHGSALSVLSAIHMDNNPACIVCHTVGFGQPTGYTNATLTPHLQNVGCENCHGAAGWHKNSDHSVIHPVVSIDPAICGSCHQDSHHPTFDEYAESLHSQVNDDVKYGFNGGTYYTNTITLLGTNLYGYYLTTNSNGTLKTNATTGIVHSLNGPQSLPQLQFVYDPGQDRAASCGVCHSGATRMAMLNDYFDRQAGKTNALTLASANDAGAWGPTCAVCHDPHSKYNVAQLRNPTWSSNYFTMATTTDKRTIKTTNFNGSITTNVAFYNTTFASLYNPNINICGQCHNTRGARWDGLAYGLLTNTVVGGAVTNSVFVDITTNVTLTQVFTNSSGVPYLTNSYPYTYVVGRYATNLVTATTTNQVVTAGLTTNVTGYSRAPHHSPQYNIPTGILQPDYLNTTNGTTLYTNSVLTNGMGIYATHSGIAPRSIFNTNQCATCHVPNYAVNSTTKVLGHTFEMDPNGCALGGCHTSGYPDWASYQIKTTNNIARIADLLNYWSTNKGPALLGTTDYNKSKQNTWEFTSPGALAGTNLSGPNTTNQLKLPAVIRQARFNTYMALNDGSYGVHNPRFVTLLLADAEQKVLSQLTTAKFFSTAADVAVNGTVTFSNLNSALTDCTWDFGDGTTTNTTANKVAHKYTSIGVKTVSITATDSNGTETLTRNNYVTVFDVVTPSMAYTPGTLTAPVTVNFTNTSINAVYGKWSFYDTSGYMASTNLLRGLSGDTATYTYTNAGTYKVKLQASNPGSSAYVTNLITIQ